MHKIAIARWLQDLIEKQGGNRTTYIPNGIDLARFRLHTPLAQRSPHRVGMLYHILDWKGCADALQALEQVRAQIPTLEAVLYSVYERPATLPAWIEYHHLPSSEQLVGIYNSCALFLHPSWAEGLPAPPAEAMACGCAVVAAANAGVQDYVEDGWTGLLAPIKSPEALAAQMLRLLQNDELRQAVARAGHDFIQGFTWKRATDQLEKLLIEGV